MITGQYHGFESIAEQRLLLALDFASELIDVVSQPMRLRFTMAAGCATPIPFTAFSIITTAHTIPQTNLRS
jgi:hypothetical protein